MNNLAIVIPAFKDMFLRDTLRSILNQSNQNFNLYIGDDCSPYDLQSIISEFVGLPNVYYVRFDNNIGSKDLVAQWERCINLIGNEEWVWLFSDDDVMDEDCVQGFYETLAQSPNLDIFCFNVGKIDQRNLKLTLRESENPDTFTSEDFLLKRLTRTKSSFAVEYIFRRTHFLKTGGFQKFDLAWGSDDATWIKLGRRNGFRTIPNCKVHWRVSQFNISPNIDLPILLRKFTSEISYAAWVLEGVKAQRIRFKVPFIIERLEWWFLYSIKENCCHLSHDNMDALLHDFYLKIFGSQGSKAKRIQLFAYRFIKNIVSPTLKTH